MTHFTITSSWHEYASIASHSFEHFFASAIWSPGFRKMMKRQYNEVVKHAQNQTYRQGIMLLTEQELGFPYFRELYI